MRYLYDYQNPESLRMMSQSGVKQVCLPRETRHNASWDSVLTPDGRLFFSLCSELTTSEYAKLAEYRYQTNDVLEHFYAKDVILPHERYIRDSKFHTSMAVRNNGTLIMATHTTDKAPGHPAWMPEAYFTSPWEGFPGSTLFSYDPATKKAVNLGIPAPRESIYGGCYDSRNDRYYMLGFMRGHLYCYDFKTGTSEDMGQVTERHTYRMARGSDGNIYFSTRSGVLKRILVDEKRVENLNISLPNSSESRHLARSYMSTGVNGPDGKLYISGQFHDELSAFDPKTGCLEVIGRYMQEEAFMPGPSNNAYIGAMDFDEEGVLWYLINGLRHDRKEDFKPACVLMRWDFLKGKRPERLGLAGTKERAITTSVGVFIDKAKDILYMVSTNHADEGPDITAVDLKTFRKDCCNLGPVCEDVFILPGNDAYTAHAENLQNTWRIIDQNSPLARFKEIIPVRLWNTEEKYPPEETKVANLVWKDGILHGICSGKSQLVFRIRLSGELCFLSPLAKCNEVYRTELLEAIKKEPSELLDGLDLPAYPGRNYKAKAKLSCPLDKRRTLIATEDGLLSIVNLEDKSVYALGAACSNGPVHAMVTGESGIVYGIAGDQADLGNIFTYDDKRGLRNLGRLATDGYRYGNAASCELSCLALNEKEGILAVGAKDDLGCVYLCKL